VELFEVSKGIYFYIVIDVSFFIANNLIKLKFYGFISRTEVIKLIYAYIRVSTKGQNIDRQYVEIKEFGVDDKYIYIDKESGKDFDRTNYKRLIKKLKKDDLLIIKS